MSRNSRDPGEGHARCQRQHLTPVRLDMDARAPVSEHAFSTLIFVIIFAIIAKCDQFSCSRDGLFTDYDTECQEYVRCTRGAISRRYSCAAGRMFNEVTGECVPRQQHRCIRRVCTPNDTLAYATPGTACRHYYRCENGTTLDHICPWGTWFDLERQACTHGAGTCYEPICAGLLDGSYPDSSHECRRILQCQGSVLRAVVSCPTGVCSSSCPSPRSASIPLPAGDADFCSDETCSSLCEDIKDGAYADRESGCREYFVCESGRVIRRGVCEAGLLFSNGGCEPKSGAFCPPAARSPCFNRADGLHRDWRNCSSWFECRRERVVNRASCAGDFVFDGAKCVSPNNFSCVGPEQAKVCEGRPSGTYQDYESNCTRYFHCEGRRRTLLACPVGQMYDGARCSPSSRYLCPSLDRDSCYGRADGRYRALDTGCRGYYMCVAGDKTIFACRLGHIFDGDLCVPSPPEGCPTEDYSCSGLGDGYHAELESNCHRYFYCEGGDRLATLSCLGGKIFDGATCVDSSLHECGATPKNLIENSGKLCLWDGFYLQQGTECKKYYFCVGGVRTYLSCPAGQVFNGQVCVPQRLYACPG